MLVTGIATRPPSKHVPPAQTNRCRATRPCAAVPQGATPRLPVAGVAELLLHAKEPPRADREGESAVRSAEAAATYWNSRQAEVDSRQKAADERKKKYARTGGEN